MGARHHYGQIDIQSGWGEHHGQLGAGFSLAPFSKEHDWDPDRPAKRRVDQNVLGPYFFTILISKAVASAVPQLGAEPV